MKKLFITFTALFISVIAFGQSKTFALYNLKGELIEVGTVQESMYDDTITMRNIDEPGIYFLQVNKEGEYGNTWKFVTTDDDHIDVVGEDAISPRRIISYGKPVYLQRNSKSNNDGKQQRH